MTTTPDSPSALAPYDTVLLLSFGGPEGPDDVMPFLRAVTAGRGVPDERLAEVAEHYHHFGGRSPINDQNRALLASLRDELDRRGLDVRVVWGNRNWQPYLVDVLRQVHAEGGRRVVAIMTSAYCSYSSCRQYREDLGAALLTLADEGVRLDVDLQVDRIRPYFNHPAFVEPMVGSTRDALATLPAGSHVAFVTHSIPESMDAGSGPDGRAYSTEHLDLARTIATALHRDGSDAHHTDGAPEAVSSEAAVPWSLVYCSRSGAPHQPWLEPDVGDHLRALAEQQVPGVAVVPIGFVSDHMEVVYDLDTEAQEVAEEVGLPFVRAATVGTHPTFVSGLVDLLLERAAQARGEQPPQPVLGDLPPVHVVCPTGCCPNPRGVRPAACGADWSPAVSA
ncbi:MAG TPA: ferrochelatase [Actinomycetales bacterium]|nr:ferrochelatase [Actinomycetales bacterium]